MNQNNGRQIIRIVQRLRIFLSNPYNIWAFIPVKPFIQGLRKITSHSCAEDIKPINHMHQGAHKQLCTLQCSWGKSDHLGHQIPIELSMCLCVSMYLWRKWFEIRVEPSSLRCLEEWRRLFYMNLNEKDEYQTLWLWERTKKEGWFFLLKMVCPQFSHAIPHKPYTSHNS